MRKRTVGIIGCGLITQVEHLPNLLGLRDRFEVIGVADPSEMVRAYLHKTRGVVGYAEAGELLDLKPDCVVIATPDAFHVDLTLEALARGMHVFVEKPLCYDPADAVRIAAARDRAGKIVQVGYMKRFDPAYLALYRMLMDQKTELLSVNVDVLDPDFWPFTAHHDVIFGNDLPEEAIAENGRKRMVQIEAALGRTVDTQDARGFAGPLCSSLVHDVNLVSGALGAIGRSSGAPISAAFHGGDRAAIGAARIAGSDALINLSWTAVPKLAHYSERISFAFEDAQFELKFPSPYLNHQPTELIERRSTGIALTEIRHRPSYAEAFVDELCAWHDAMESETPAKNSVESAGADMSLLAGLGRLAIAAR
ncbi:MAG: Gfo/Idh/MocA family oxidoreductase [Hyphomicrobiaceae bacterium]|nr:Gfo/Idh/MocA family oxidoreductase [Hyphomicrobiaceae bacterium]